MSKTSRSCPGEAFIWIGHKNKTSPCHQCSVPIRVVSVVIMMTVVMPAAKEVLQSAPEARLYILNNYRLHWLHYVRGLVLVGVWLVHGLRLHIGVVVVISRIHLQ